MQAITCAPKAIVVGIDNGGSTRLDEYSPWVNAQYGGGQGDVYMDWLANNLKPYIDNTYRTLPDRAHTGIMGSSMGGLISFYGAMQYQNVFGKAGIMSPSFWFSNQVQPFITAQGMQADDKFYFVCGGNESISMVSDMDAVIATMQTAGFAPNTNTKRVVKADGQHAEWFWKREFAAAYCWLFSDLVVATQAEIGTDTVLLNALQNPFGDSLTLHLAALAGKSTITIHDISGKKVYSTVVENTEQLTIPTAHLPKGSYVVGLQNGAQIQTIQVIK